MSAELLMAKIITNLKYTYKDCQLKVSYLTFKTANMPHIVHCFPCMTRYVYSYFPLWVFSEKSS